MKLESVRTQANESYRDSSYFAISIFLLMIYVLLPSRILLGQSSFSKQPSDHSDETANPRDEASLSILRKSYRALGGEQGWEQLRSTKVTGSQEDQLGKRPFVWADSWGDDYHSRGSVRESKAPSIAQRTERAEIRAPGPQFSSFSRLMTHAPGAALRLALKDTTYQVRPSPFPAKDGNSCLQISILDKPLWQGGLFSILCVSKETSLPVTVELALPPGPKGGPIAFETIRYETYERQGDALRPAQVSISKPGGLKTVVTIQSVEYATGNRDFTKEAAK